MGATKTQDAILLVEGGLPVAKAAAQVGIKPTTVYAELRKRRPEAPSCPLCRGEVPLGHRFDPVIVTVPGSWIGRWDFLATVLLDAGVPIAEDFPKGRVTRGTLEREDDTVAGVVRFVWRP